MRLGNKEGTFFYVRTCRGSVRELFIVRCDTRPFVGTRFLLTLPFALPQLYHQPLCLVWLLIYVGATNYYGAVCLG